MALVLSREDDGEGPAMIRYQFVVDGGVVLSGRSVDHWYRLHAGSMVPVFYSSNNVRDHVAACGCWFEAE
jgi:hypothetical protein